MTALIIIGSVLLLIVLLLFVPVSVRFSFRDGDWKASAHYLFLRFDFSPEALARRAAKDAEKKVTGEPEVSKKAKEKEDTQKGKPKGLDTVRLVWLMFKASRRHLVIYRVRINILVAREDAHETAVAYGQMTTGVSLALAFLGEVFTLLPARVQIFPDFTREQSVYDISLRLRVIPWNVVLALRHLLIKLIKPGNKQKRQKIKGGKQHESAKHNQ